MTAGGSSVAPAGDRLLVRLRREISDLDRSLVEMLNRRLGLVAEVKRHKDEVGLGFVDLGREEWMLQYLRRANRGPLSDEGLAEFHESLLRLMKREVARAES